MLIYFLIYVNLKTRAEYEMEIYYAWFPLLGIKFSEKISK